MPMIISIAVSAVLAVLLVERKLDEEYHRMEDEKEEAARADQPILPPLRSESKVLS